jgi:hypothetical protein
MMPTAPLMKRAMSPVLVWAKKTDPLLVMVTLRALLLRKSSPQPMRERLSVDFRLAPSSDQSADVLASPSRADIVL